MRHGGKDGGVDAAGIIQEAADLLLERLDGSCVEGSGRVGSWRLQGCTVSGWDIDGGGCSCGVAGYIESCEDLINVTRHGQRNSVGRRVKVDGEANVRVTVPVDLYFVQLT